MRAGPCVELRGTVLNEPLGTFLVFFLAALWIGVGGYFLLSRRGRRSRGWLGLALLLGGVGATQAGISFQAFSYQFKCAGRQVCDFTNGFEVGYSLTQAASVSAMVIAVAIACSQGRTRRGVIVYAVLNAVVYFAVATVGVRQPSKLLLSFEVLMLFCTARHHPGDRAGSPPPRASPRTRRTSHPHGSPAPDRGQCRVLRLLRCRGNANPVERWRRFCFSANDVLHVGMIVWLIDVAVALGPILADRDRVCLTRPRRKAQP